MTALRLVACSALFMVAACSGPRITSDYGEERLPSLNGFSILHGAMINAFDAEEARAFSSALGSSDLLIVPMREARLPSEEESKWMRDWLEEKDDRQIILFLRDGAPSEHFRLRFLDELAARKEKTEDRKELAKIEEDIEALENLGSDDDEIGDALWNSIESDVSRLGFELEWLDLGLDLEATIRTSGGFMALDYVPEGFVLPHAIRHTTDIRPLIWIDEDIYAAEVPFDGSRLIVFANASPFVDVTLVSRDARTMLEALVEYVGDWKPKKARWLESTAIRDPGEGPPTSMFEALFLREPTRWISFHFLAAGLLFVLARWRHLGRTQSLPSTEPRRFGGHVAALARNLEKRRAWATLQRELERYHGIEAPAPRSLEHVIGNWRVQPRRSTRTERSQK